MMTTTLPQETLPPLTAGNVPRTFEELWAGFDPRAEPLAVKILKEWEEEGAVLQVLRYRVGIFKGQPSIMAAVYGRPATIDHRRVPGLVQLHGGGQYANAEACRTNARRGYATISISWGGRIEAPDYRVSPDETKLFWEGKTDDPHYKLITDWGALDAYHAPNRHPDNSNWSDLKPADWTLDAVDSPRNSNWFLCTLAARRALTFLEQQPEVDPGRLGVYGHSMGGKLAVMTAATDDRVRAAAPSCGGISHRTDDDPLARATICDDVYLPHVTCPIIFLSPSNDFHGRINDLPASITEIRSTDWRVVCAAHHNHQDTAAYEVATQVWMDQHLKDTFTVPATPETSLELKTDSGVPRLTVQPDRSRPIRSVDVYYTQHGQMDGKPDDRENTGNRFWHHAATVNPDKDTWTAELPLISVDRSLWVYANVMYSLDEPVTGAGYYYRGYTTEEFNLSSLVHLVSAAELQAAGVRVTRAPSLMIETFAGDWEKEWFTYRPEHWARTTHKVYDPGWAAPAGATLAFAVRSAQPNRLVIGIDQYAAEIELAGGDAWQEVTLAAADFKDASETGLPDWGGIRELRFAAEETLRVNRDGDELTRAVGAEWNGAAPRFRNLRWETDPAGGAAGRTAAR